MGRREGLLTNQNPLEKDTAHKLFVSLSLGAEHRSELSVSRV